MSASFWESWRGGAAEFGAAMLVSDREEEDESLPSKSLSLQEVLIRYGENQGRVFASDSFYGRLGNPSLLAFSYFYFLFIYLFFQFTSYCFNWKKEKNRKETFSFQYIYF